MVKHECAFTPALAEASHSGADFKLSSVPGDGVASGLGEYEGDLGPASHKLSWSHGQCVNVQRQELLLELDILMQISSYAAYLAMGLALGLQVGEYVGDLGLLEGLGEY